MAFSAARAVTWVLVAVIGVLYGMAGTIAHAYAVAGIPVGLVLAVVGAAALLAAVRLLTLDRWAALAAGLGMLAATLIFSGQGPGGSVIVPQAAAGQFDPGIIWTFAVPLLVALVMAWPDMSRFRPADAD